VKVQQQAAAFLHGLYAHMQDERLMDAFEQLIEAYFAEYTDATEVDRETYWALEHLFDMCFPSGTEDGRTLDDLVTRNE